MNDLECPYCDAPNEVCHDDGQGYDEGKAHEMTCCDCGKNFVFHTSISFYYSPEKADCLNGSPHNFGEWRKLWLNAKDEEIQDRRCKECDHTERRTVPNSPANATVEAPPPTTPKTKMENRSEIPEKQTASLGSPLMPCSASSCHHAECTRQSDGTWKCTCGKTWNRSEFWMRDLCGCGNDKPATWIMCGACDRRFYD